MIICRRKTCRRWRPILGDCNERHRHPQGTARRGDGGKVFDAGPEGTYPPTEEMLDAPVDAEVKARREADLRRAWETPKGWRYWSAVNNTEVGVWYSLTAFSSCCARACWRC